MPSITHGQSMDSISDSIVHIGDNEIKECAIEALEPFKNELEAQSFDLNELGTSDLIKAWKKIEDFKGAGLKDAFDLADLIKGQIAGFNKEKLQEMCTFSKISYGNVDRKLKQDEYKTKRQFEEEGYQIIKFYDNELIEDKYCSDTDYKLEQQDVGYALMSSNSYNRDAGYVFIKGQEVTIAYHGTRDLNDVKEDLRASLAKLSFLPEDHRVHSGFYSLFKRSWPSVHKLKGHANDKGLAIKDLKINVTGHSMGGALANIAALCLNKTEDAEDVHVATFGSPRVFYNGAAEVYNQCLGNKTIRVACQSDPVPCLPHGNAGMHYKHVGKSLKLETGKTLEYLELHYHRINIYYNLVREVEQKNFKSDNNPSKYRHIAYIFGLFYHAVLSYVDVNDKEFFKKVEEENKDIKLSEIPIQYAPKLEEKIKLLEQEVAKPTNDKTQLEGRLKSIQQSLVGKTKELDDEKGKLTQEQQKTNQLNDQIDKLTAEFKGTKDQLAEKKAELDEQTSKVMQLSKESNEARAQLEKKKKEIGKLKDQVDQMTIQNNQLEGQLDDAKQGLTDKTDEVTRLTQVADTLNGRVAQLTTQNDQLEGQLNDARQSFADQIMQRENENNDLKTKLQEIENKSEVLEKSLQKQFESKNEELSEKFLKARTYSKRQGNYASVSFVLSGAFAVGTSLTMVHLAMCVSLAVAALTFLAVGCYCSYNANTALNNVEVSQIGNDLSHSLV